MRRALILIVFALAACKPTAEQQARVQRSLPAGCELRDLGGYGSIENFVVIFCSGRPSTSTHISWSVQAGKVRIQHYAASFAVWDR